MTECLFCCVSENHEWMGAKKDYDEHIPSSGDVDNTILKADSGDKERACVR